MVILFSSVFVLPVRGESATFNEVSRSTEHVAQCYEVSKISPYSVKATFYEVVTPPSIVSFAGYTITPIAFVPLTDATSYALEPWGPSPRGDKVELK